MFTRSNRSLRAVAARNNQRKVSAMTEILDGSGYVVFRIPTNLKETIMTNKNFWQLSYTIHTGRRGAPTKHRGMYLSKDSAEQAMRRVIRVQHGKVRNIVLTNKKENY
jgi:hypothetical protein